MKVRFITIFFVKSITALLESLQNLSQRNLREWINKIRTFPSIWRKFWCIMTRCLFFYAYCVGILQFHEKSFKDPFHSQKLISRNFRKWVLLLYYIVKFLYNHKSWLMCEFYVPFSTKWTWARSLDDFSLWILRISIEMITIIPISHSPHFSVQKTVCLLLSKAEQSRPVCSWRWRNANLLRLSFQFASSKKENKNISVKWLWFTIVKWLVNKLLVRHFSWLKLFEIQPSTFEESCGLGKRVFTDCFLGIRQNKSSIFLHAAAFKKLK